MGDWFCKVYLAGYEKSGFQGEDGKVVLFVIVELEIPVGWSRSGYTGLAWRQ